jgi:hypothetical protein
VHPFSPSRRRPTVQVLAVECPGLRCTYIQHPMIPSCHGQRRLKGNLGLVCESKASDTLRGPFALFLALALNTGVCFERAPAQRKRSEDVILSPRRISCSALFS